MCTLIIILTVPPKVTLATLRSISKTKPLTREVADEHALI